MPQSGFAALFERLDAAKERLGILGFGLSVNTMEDVFLRVSPEKAGTGDHDDHETNGMDRKLASWQADAGQAGKLMLKDEKLSTVANGNGYGAVERKETNGLRSKPVRPYKRLTGFELWLGQMRGLLTKRAIYTWRRWLLYAAIVSYSRDSTN